MRLPPVLASALQRDPQAALGARLDLGAIALERRDRRLDVEAGGVRGAEDELAGLAQAQGDALDAVDPGRVPGGSR